MSLLPSKEGRIPLLEDPTLRSNSPRVSALSGLTDVGVARKELIYTSVGWNNALLT